MKITCRDSETSANGQQVITVCAFIHSVKDGIRQVFLPRRADTKRFLPGVYELPGGHVDFGENLLDGLAREFREEFGTEITIGDPFAAFTYSNPVKGSHSVEIVYFAQFSDKDSIITLNPEDHSEFDWFGEDELSRAITDTKGLEDPEFEIIIRGFRLLAGESICYGSQSPEKIET